MVNFYRIPQRKAKMLIISMISEYFRAPSFTVKFPDGC
jgi:hypothetical protein